MDEKVICATPESVPGCVIIDNAPYCKIGSRYRRVIGAVKSEKGRYLPVVDINWMSDEQWNELAKLHPVPSEAAKAEVMSEAKVPASPRQISFLEAKGFQHVADWNFAEAKTMIERIAANGWRVPKGVNPMKYRPQGVKDHAEGVLWVS